MRLSIDFGQPILPEQVIRELTPDDLNDFYCQAGEVDQLNLFFVLLASLHGGPAQRTAETSAHLNFLIAYYLFVPLTPPGSQELALHYIRKAIALAPKPEYLDWQLWMERGN